MCFFNIISSFFIFVIHHQKVETRKYVYFTMSRTEARDEQKDVKIITFAISV